MKGHFTPEPVTSIPLALSLVEKAMPVQVCFTLRLRDQHKMDVKSTWIPTWHQMDHGHLG